MLHKLENYPGITPPAFYGPVAANRWPATGAGIGVGGGVGSAGPAVAAGTDAPDGSGRRSNRL